MCVHGARCTVRPPNGHSERTETRYRDTIPGSMSEIRTLRTKGLKDKGFPERGKARLLVKTGGERIRSRETLMTGRSRNVKGSWDLGDQEVDGPCAEEQGLETGTNPHPRGLPTSHPPFHTQTYRHTLPPTNLFVYRCLPYFNIWVLQSSIVKQAV